MRKNALLSKQGLAERWGVDERTVSRYVRAGLPCSGSPRNLRFDAQACERWRATHIVQRAPKITTSAAAIIHTITADPSEEFRQGHQNTDPVRICSGCGGAFRKSTALHDRSFSEADRFCSELCRDWVSQGHSAAWIQKSLLSDMMAAADRAERAEIVAEQRAGVAFDDVGPSYGGVFYATSAEISAARGKSRVRGA